MQAQTFTWLTSVPLNLSAFPQDPSKTFAIQKQLVNALQKAVSRIGKERLIELSLTINLPEQSPPGTSESSPKSSLSSSPSCSSSSSPSSEEFFVDDEGFPIESDWVVMKNPTAEAAKANDQAAALIQGKWIINSTFSIKIEANSRDARYVEASVNKLHDILSRKADLPKAISAISEEIIRQEYSSLGRVSLSGKQITLKINSEEKRCDANHIKLNGRNYIAASGYIPADLFWELIYQKEVCMFVKLTEGQPSYLVDKKKTFRDGLEVSFSYQKRLAPSILQRTFFLQRGDHGQFTIQIDFNGWPDFGIPKLDDFCSLLKIVEEFTNKMPGSLLVHCGAGIGRTGTFLAAHSNFNNPNPDFPATVLEMRRQRSANMVETPEQYALLYRASQAIQESKNKQVTK